MGIGGVFGVHSFYNYSKSPSFLLAVPAKASLQLALMLFFSFLSYSGTANRAADAAVKCFLVVSGASWLLCRAKFKQQRNALKDLMDMQSSEDAESKAKKQVLLAAADAAKGNAGSTPTSS